MLAPYQLSVRTRTYFGSGCTEQALQKEQELLGPRVLLVSTGRSLRKHGYLDDLVRMIGADVAVCDCISANPDVTEIREAVKAGKEMHASSVVGFGGGSAVDAAKAAAAGIVSEYDVGDFLSGQQPLPENPLPVIAVPTTAGTGAELTKGAIISDRERGIKGGIRGEQLIPAAAVVDPSYTETLPLKVTLESGFDVFAHAAESYCAVKANPFSEMLSEKAVRITGAMLPRLCRSLKDTEAREQMSFAAHIMGYNVNNVGNCLPHRLQYPVGAETDTSHGAGLAALYPAWFRHEETVQPERVGKLLEWLGCSGDEAPDVRIHHWLEMLGVSRTLTDLGIRSPAEELAGRVSGSLANDRLAGDPDVIRKIYEESI